MNVLVALNALYLSWDFMTFGWLQDWLMIERNQRKVRAVKGILWLLFGVGWVMYFITPIRYVWLGRMLIAVVPCWMLMMRLFMPGHWPLAYRWMGVFLMGYFAVFGYYQFLAGWYIRVAQ